MAYTKRWLTLKYVRFKSGRSKTFDPPAIEDCIAQVMKKSGGFSNRHLPPAVNSLSQGSFCLFLNKSSTSSRGGLMLELCSYVYGTAPEQFSPDFSASAATIAATPVLDSAGRPRYIAHTYRALALGQAMILESTHGAGGVDPLEDLLSYLFRKFVDPNLPAVELLDVTGTKLRDAIKAGGGAVKMSLKVVDGVPELGSYYGTTLLAIKKHVKNAKQLLLEWESESNKELSPQEISEVFAEYGQDDSPLAKVVVHLKKGGKIDHLERYRERRQADVRQNSMGQIVVTELQAAMRDYLDELRTPIHGAVRILDDAGNFVNPQVLKTRKKA